MLIKHEYVGYSIRNTIIFGNKHTFIILFTRCLIVFKTLYGLQKHIFVNGLGDLPILKHKLMGIVINIS